MVYRENELPKWRSITITHKVAGELLKTVGRKVKWLQAGGGYLVLSESDLRTAVTLFLNRLNIAGIPPRHIQIAFQPETGKAIDDWRSKFTIFYYGNVDVSPSP